MSYIAVKVGLPCRAQSIQRVRPTRWLCMHYVRVHVYVRVLHSLFGFWCDGLM